MSKKEVRQAAAELTERLCEKDFLDRSGLSRKNVMMLMNKDHWEEQFARIFPIKKRISCRAVYEICEEPLSLLGHEPEEGWMKFTYQYVCHILYPDAEFKKENAAFSAGAEFYLAVLQFVFGPRAGGASVQTDGGLLHFWMMRKLQALSARQNTAVSRSFSHRNTSMR